MKKRRIPLRKDLLTNTMQPKKSLVRIVTDKAGHIEIDPTGKKAGRGAYVSLDPDKIKAAQKSGVIEKSLGHKIDPQFYEELQAYVDHQKARQELFGEQK